MVISSPLRSRRTLLWWLTPFKRDTDPEAHLFWVVTSLVAAWLVSTVLIDIALHWRAIVGSTMELWATLISAVLGLAYCILPMVMRLKFPRWCGLVGYLATNILLANNIFYIGDEMLATTALHILPVLGMYLGWFWDYRTSLPAFAFSIVLILGATFLSPLVGEQEFLSVMIITFTVFIMVVTFLLAAFLSRDLATAAATDSLTGVLNMRGLRKRLTHEMARARRRTEPLVVAVTDFDGFKQLNDSRGHVYGDEVLRLNATRWVKDLRVYDVVARLGGDEFVFIFPRTSAAHAAQVLRRLQGISSHAWSWGLAQQRPDDTVETILARADARLYEKKIHSSDEHQATEPLIHENTDGIRTGRHRQRYRHRQSPFSLLSASLGLLLLIPLAVGRISGEMPPLGESSWVVGTAWFVGLAILVISVTCGDRLSLNTSMWFVGAVMFVYINMAFILETLMLGVGIFYAFSLLAMYLGTFQGTSRSRVLLFGSLVIVALPFLILAFTHQNDAEQMVAVTIVIYAFSVCFVLFELSTYLYNRSRILVEHDALTGVLNRYGLAEYGEAEVSRAERGKYPITAVMLDCVGFKQVNDTHGHQAGNRLLAELALHVRAGIAPDDVLVRMGGDEFLLLVPYMSEQRTREHVQTILAGAPIRMHVGFAEWRAGDTLESLIARADRRHSTI